MAEQKILVNKHYENPSSITESVFTTSEKREGEIIICSNNTTPGIYIFTSSNAEEVGKVIKLNSGEYTVLSNGKTVDEAVDNLQEQIDAIVTASTITIKSTRVERHTESFIGDDGKEHDAGIYLIMEFGDPEGGSSIYAYADVTELFQDEWYGTEEEYQAMVEAGTIDPNKTYYTYEE